MNDYFRIYAFDSPAPDLGARPYPYICGDLQSAVNLCTVLKKRGCHIEKVLMPNGVEIAAGRFSELSKVDILLQAAVH